MNITEIRLRVLREECRSSWMHFMIRWHLGSASSEEASLWILEDTGQHGREMHEKLCSALIEEPVDAGMGTL